MNQEQRCVFAIDEGKTTVLIGIPAAAYDYIKDGRTHTFDLRSLGIPVKIALFGGQDRAACLAPLNITKDTLDVSGLDFGFGRED